MQMIGVSQRNPERRRSRRLSRRDQQRQSRRRLLLEKLEDRTLLAVTGPRLTGLLADGVDLLPLDGSGVRNTAPHALTFRFDENQQVDPGTLSGIRIIRAGLDGTFDDDRDGKTENGEYVRVTPGYLGVGSAPQQHEVIVRFAETLPDDVYRIELYGIGDGLQGISALRNTQGEAFGDLTDDGGDNGTNLVVGFQLELGPQVLAVVPQPLSQVPDPVDPGRLIWTQARDQIVVYFSDDDLFVEDGVGGAPTQRSAENPAFYQLISTRETLRNTDDLVVYPTAVDYDPRADTATLTFAQDLAELVDPSLGTLLGPGTFRLRIGTDEPLPAAPLEISPQILASTDFGTGGEMAGGVDVTFSAKADYAQAMSIVVTKAALGPGAPPQVAQTGNTIHILLNTTTPSTAADLVAAVGSHPGASALVNVSLAGNPATDITTPAAPVQLRLAGLGSSFETATDLGGTLAGLSSSSVLISAAIAPQESPLDYPGSSEEPGHRQLPEEVGVDPHVNADFGPDQTPGATTIAYHFPAIYGVDEGGNPLLSVITEQQRTRVRESLDLWSQQLGVQFVETSDLGLAFVAGQPSVLDPADLDVVDEADEGFRVRVDPGYQDSLLVIDATRQWKGDYGGDWFQRVLVGVGFLLGLQRADDLPVSNVMAYAAAEPYAGGLESFFSSGIALRPEGVAPGNADILHGQYLYRPDSNDLDLYRFTIDLEDHVEQPRSGRLTVEAFAERLPSASLLDTVLSLYREAPELDINGTVVGYRRELMARNDDYDGRDSFLDVTLGSGTYYVAVSASGNTDFDPVIEDTGSGGTTQGEYQLRLDFRPQAAAEHALTDRDRADAGLSGTLLDGDADGVPGGVYNFWFQTRPLRRAIDVTGDGSTVVDGQTLTIQDASLAVLRFEFDVNGSVSPVAIPIRYQLDSTPEQIAAQVVYKINDAAMGGFGVTALLQADGRSLVLEGERWTGLSNGARGVALAGKTIFVSKLSGTSLNGSLSKPFDSLAVALAQTIPGDIVRVLGNGGFDGDRTTLGDNIAYEVGANVPGGPSLLSDGATLNVPRGVTLMIDAGAVFKLWKVEVGVGSASPAVDRSRAALQVLGTPQEPVYFTSWRDESLGLDWYGPVTTPTAGDWGGIHFRANLDAAESRFNYEDEGIFLNSVNHADLRYGGGRVRIDFVDFDVSPLHLSDARPTLAWNTIVYSRGAAMSATPDSFAETRFHEPPNQWAGVFTSDYERCGPEIIGNRLFDNELNGLSVQTVSPDGGATLPLTAAGRFDDRDVVHVLQADLQIQGQAGTALLETEAPTMSDVTLASQAGGALAPGSYRYRMVAVDDDGLEGRPSEASFAITLGAGQGAVVLGSLPLGGGEWVAKRLYRSQAGGAGPYGLVAELSASQSSYLDAGASLGAILQREPPSVQNVNLGTGALGGQLTPDTYRYRLVWATDDGRLSPASDPTDGVTLTGEDDMIALMGLPIPPWPYTRRLIYRSPADGSAPYRLAGEVSPLQDYYIDWGTVAGDVLDFQLLGVVRARADASLKIDPGVVVKLAEAGIEARFGGQLLAEGLAGREVVFTALTDDRYGAGGTFDTNGDDGPGEAAAEPGAWTGLYFGPTSRLSLEQAHLAFGGGMQWVQGSPLAFNAVEVHQAEARLAQSVIEQNASGSGGQEPAGRYGLGPHDGATIFIRGAQPVLVDNILRDNADVAVSINADAFTHEMVADPGRSTGWIGSRYADEGNQGPLLRGNRLANNGPADAHAGSNGLEVRTAGVDSAGALVTTGITLATESVWDDTDIVHILYDEIRVSNQHTYGGLRLESRATESLVVKLYGPGNVNGGYQIDPCAGAGFTATGIGTEDEDRIGGALYVLGQPGYPVAITSLRDDTVGAGLLPNGRPQRDTNNDGTASAPQPGDWRSLRLDPLSHDRNVELLNEREWPDSFAIGSNATPGAAEWLGNLAVAEQSSDENLRLGFSVQGLLSTPDDLDVYRFTAAAGSEVWLDIDRTASSLDAVLEVLDANGQRLALSDQSLDETLDPSLLDRDPYGSSPAIVHPLQQQLDVYQPHHASGLVKESGSLNPRDAGLRVVLPGVAGERFTYFVRVRSSNLRATDPADKLFDAQYLAEGRTAGVYQLQIRLREADEVPGSTVRFADLRYSQNGLELIGVPRHSPLVGEAAEDEGVGGTLASNGTLTTSSLIPGQRPQDVGNLLTTDRGALAVAGSLSASYDVDYYRFEAAYEGLALDSPQHSTLALDIDYADNLQRPDTTVTVFDSLGRPVLIGRDANIADDLPAPVLAADDPQGLHDLSRGSAGPRDPFLGPVAVPEGVYYAAVSSDQYLPEALLNDPEVRLEPVNSLVRIAEDHIGSWGGSTAEGPLVPVLLDPTFDGTTVSPANLWHVSTREATTAGHGLTPAFDGSRAGLTVGVVVKSEPNDSLATAMSLEAATWSLNADADIGNMSTNTSQLIPHLTIQAVGNDTYDYYSFAIPQATPAEPIAAIFDIDGGWIVNSLANFDAEIFLFDAAGTLLASNDDAAYASWGGGGSTATLDSYVEYSFTSPGSYMLGVARFNSSGTSGAITGPGVSNGATYTLHVSIAGRAAEQTAGNGGATFYFGREDTGDYQLGAGTIASGSLVSNAFSLQDYAAADKPVLYFSYRLDADAGDYLRAYVRRPDGSEQLVASSDPAQAGSGVVTLTNDQRWRQARVELDAFAGLAALRLRFAFQAADDAPGTRQGVHLDDVIIGFAERGEMVTGAPANPAFMARAGYDTTGRTLSGAYQLEVRQATDYGTSVALSGSPAAGLVLDRSFDTNDRQIRQTTLIAPAGADLYDGSTFQLGDGTQTVAFEYTTDGAVSAGHVPILFSALDADWQIAARIRDAINNGSVQAVLQLQASLADGTASGVGSRDNRVNLYGNAVGDFGVQPAETALTVEESDITGAVAFGTMLRDYVLGTGLMPTGNPAFVGGVDATDGTFTSAGIFQGGLSSIGIESGIVLATGNAASAGGPNTANSNSGAASLQGDADLDNEFFPLEPESRKTKDATSLTFPVYADFTGTAYFNFVFASEEYNELVGTATQADALGVFVKDLTTPGSAMLNVALVPGTASPVSRSTVNGGNPFGVGASHPLLYNNNDLREGGTYLRQLGYDGFTDVFTARFDVVAGREYQIKFAIGDAGNTQVDSAVFIAAGTLGAVNPAPAPVGLLGVLHNGSGDSNHFRDQGQTLVYANTIADAADFGIVVDAGDREGVVEAGWQTQPLPLGSQQPGPVRNLVPLNDFTQVGVVGGFAPGAAIVNNLLVGGGLGGIHVSGELRPYELTTRRPSAYPQQSVYQATAADGVCDGDAFRITVGRTTVEFEFEDVSRSPASDSGYACAVGGGGGNEGWTPGRVPVLYSRSAAGVPGFSQLQMAMAIETAISTSFLVRNGTTVAANAIAGPSQWGNNLTNPASGPDPAVYVEHAREVSVLPNAHSGSSNPTFGNLRLAGVANGSQPFARIVNNTVVGNDGQATFFPDDPAAEPNDTLWDAVDTRQGRAASPEVFAASSLVIGDTTALPGLAAADVDFYEFQLDRGDHVRVNAGGSGFRPQLRLFDSLGGELLCGGAGAPVGAPTCTVNGQNVTLEFSALTGDTYFVGVSGEGNDDYDPLSLAGHVPATAAGSYAITVNVLAPRRWVLDTAELVLTAGTFQIFDLDDRSATISVGGVSVQGNTPLVTEQVTNQIAAVIAAGQLSAAVQTTTLGSAHGARYVVIEGASKIIRLSGPAGSLTPALDANNDDNGFFAETGILISEEATPTLLNNVLANCRNAIVETENPAGSPRLAVVGASMFQHNSGNWSVSTVGGAEPEEQLTPRTDSTDFNIPLSASEPLFVSVSQRHLLPAAGSRAIDSSVLNLLDRPQLAALRASLGIAASPIIAPSRDAWDQLRRSDPTVPPGGGQDLYIDRGALDRADWYAPWALLLDPLDNDSAGQDLDPAATVVQVSGRLDQPIVIQLVDGESGALAVSGAGLDDASVDGYAAATGLRPGAAVTLSRNGVVLQEGLDYGFEYDPMGNRILLAPASGAWPDDSVYRVQLNNRDRFLLHLADGGQVVDGATFEITDAQATTVVFQYDSGFVLQVSPGVPTLDGERLVIGLDDDRDPGTPLVLRTFEFDRDGTVAPDADVAIPLLPADTYLDVAEKLAYFVRTSPALALPGAGHLENGLVYLGGTAAHTLDASASPSLTVSGQPESGLPGARQVPFEPWPGFTAEDLARVVQEVVQGTAELSGVTATPAGAGELFLDFVDLLYTGADFVSGPISVRGIDYGFLPAIQDRAGNWLLANQPTGATQFTIICGASAIDYGDARRQGSTYPTLRGETGARHAVSEGLLLGARSDRDADGQPLPGGLGDDLDHWVDAGNSSLTLTGLAPYVIQVPPGAFVVDGSRFAVQPAGAAATVFEFFDYTIPGNVPAPDTDYMIAFEPSYSAAEMGGVVWMNVTSANLGLSPADLGGGRVYLGGTSLHRVDVGGTALQTRGVPVHLLTAVDGWMIVDGQQITVDDGLNLPVVLEFDRDQNVSVGTWPIPYTFGDGAAAVAAAIRAAVAAAQAAGELDASFLLTELGDGSLHVTGLPSHTLDLRDSGLTYAGATPATLTVPAAGLGFELTPGRSIQDGNAFLISDGANTVAFEFELSANGVGPGNVAVVVQEGSSDDDIVSAMLAAIVSSIQAPGGLSDVAGLEPQNLRQGRLQIGGFGWVDASGTPALAERGVAGGICDSQTFRLDDGSDIWQFEFDADQRVTPGNIPLAFDPAGSSADLAAAVAYGVAASGFGSDLYDLGAGLLRFEGDDEDGVRFAEPLTPGAVVSVVVTASAPGRLDAWLDWTVDGDFDDASEQLFAAESLTAGPNVLYVTVPAWAAARQTFARFRFSREGGLSPSGLALDGEVEDYAVTIVTNDPPVLTVPGPRIALEDAWLTIPGIAVSDADAGAGIIQVTLTVWRGTLWVGEWLPGGLTSADIGGNNTSTVVLRGTLSQINTTLASPVGLLYIGLPNFFGADALRVVADDLGNSGTGGPRRDIATIPLTVVPVNDPPLVSLQPTVTELPEDTSTAVRIAVAEVAVLDDEQGTNALSLSGADAELFTYEDGVLYLRAGAPLDFETDPVLDVTIEVDDPTVGNTPDDLAALSITITNVVETLIVTAFTATASGFVAEFNRALERSELNLYDGAGGGLGPADVTVTGVTYGAVRGSLVVSADQRQMTFVQTGELLRPDTYTVTLFSGATRLREPSGATLDGNADETAGDDYQTTFTVAARPAGTVTVSLPDIARGAGQPVNVPNTASGLPIRLSDAAGVKSLAVDLVYDPALLAITAATLAAGLPGDWAVVNPPDISTPGVAKIRASGTTALSGTNVEAVRLTAAVPGTASYGAVQAIRLENVSLNGGAIAGVGDVAVHKAVYLGDADGSGIHSSADAFLTVQTALGLASGFAAHAWTDPRIVGDADGSDVLSAADAFLIVQEGLGLSEPFVPDNPHITVTPVSGGVDPQFRIDVNIPASAAGVVTVPVQLDIEAAATNVGGFDFDLFFDPSQLTIRLPDGVSAGADTAGWAVSAILAAPGHLRVGMVSSTGQPLAPGLREIARLQFRVEGGESRRTGWQPVPDGLANRPTWLDIEPVDARAGGYTWTDADGSVLIRPAQRALAGATREPVWRDLDAKAELLESVLAEPVHEIASAWR